MVAKSTTMRKTNWFLPDEKFSGIVVDRADILRKPVSMMTRTRSIADLTRRGRAIAWYFP